MLFRSTGVRGYASKPTGQCVGVEGQSDSTSGTGVYGLNPAYTGSTVGVYGQSNSNSGRGVVGMAAAETGNTIGVSGVATSPTGIAVHGYSVGTSGATGGFALFGDGRMKVTGRSFLAAPNTAPPDADLSNASISFFLDPANNRLRVRVKYGNGTLKTGNIALA